MIHWWDHCRFKVDWQNLNHHACTEVSSSMRVEQFRLRSSNILLLGSISRYELQSSREIVVGLERSEGVTLPFEISSRLVQKGERFSPLRQIPTVPIERRPRER
jgi:hypothetical protein